MRWLVVAVVILAACKGDPEKCDRACRNYAQLVYWKQADAEIAAAPPAQRDELWKQKLAKFTADLEHGITMCSSQCITANNDKTIQCMLDAKSAEQAKACVSDQ